MNIQIYIILFLTMASSLAIEDNGKNLQEILDEAIAKLINPPEFIVKYTSKIDFDCVRNRLNIEKNGQKIYNIVDSVIVVYGSTLRCMQANATELWINLVERFSPEFYTKLTKGQFQCYQWRMQQIDPQSPFVKDFDINDMILSVDECKNYIEKEAYGEKLSKCEKAVGSFEVFSCGAFNKENLEHYILNLALMTGMENPNDKTAQINTLCDFAIPRWNKAYQCAMKRL